MIRNIWSRWSKSPVEKTQRQRVTDALADLNEVLSAMPDRPELRLDLARGVLAIDLPEQMPDEALALPAPDRGEVDKEAGQEAQKAAA